MVSRSSQRDIYANLLRDSRGLRRDQSSAREGWYESLPWEGKERSLFELEMLLKGIACFGNARNHPGDRTVTAAVAHDFAEELRILRDGIAQVNNLVRGLLGDRERAYTFGQYLSSVLPEDSSRGRLLKDQLAQESPNEALFALRSAFASFQDLTDGVLRLDHVSNRVYGALHETFAREIGRNAFFNPLLALEFRPEFDRIRTAEVLEALESLESEAAHRVAALTMLSLYRILRYLDLIDEYSSEGSARRAYLLLAVIRSDLRALTRYLGRHGADAIADGLERELMMVPAREIVARRAEFEAASERLATIRNGLESTANALRVDVRKIFLHDLPGPSASAAETEFVPSLVGACASLRASVQYAIASLCQILSPTQSGPTLARGREARRAEAERLRRELWMFMQILRAFIAKAQASRGDTNRWEETASFQFVRDFLSHFRAVGYRLVCLHDYARVEPFLAVLADLRDVDLLAPSRLETAVAEAHALYEFLGQLFQGVSEREEIEAAQFDRKDAIETLRIYLGR